MSETTMTGYPNLRRLGLTIQRQPGAIPYVRQSEIREALQRRDALGKYLLTNPTEICHPWKVEASLAITLT